MTDNPAIILSDVTKHYRLFGNAFAQMLGFMGLKRGGKHKTALSNINLRINKGEKVGVIGRNGSGKTPCTSRRARPWARTRNASVVS